MLFSIYERMLNRYAPGNESPDIRVLHAVPLWRKMEMLAALNPAAQTLALTGLRRRDPRLVKPS
jgi:hypothetical protein